MNKDDREYLAELIVNADQSGKKETSGLVAEFNRSIRTIETTLARIEEHQVGVDKHLTQLNSKIATNIDNIKKNELAIRVEGEMRSNALNTSVKEVIKPILDDLEKKEKDIAENTKEIFSAKKVVAAVLTIATLFGSFVTAMAYFNLKSLIQNEARSVQVTNN